MRHTAEVVIQALEEIPQYDIFGTSLLVQVVYSSRIQPTVVLLPAHERWDTKAESGPDWRIQVHISEPGGVVTSVTTDGPIEIVSTGSPKGMLSRAVLAACRILAVKGGFGVPAILSTKAINNEYYVTFTWLPEVIGGYVTVCFSEDLREHSFLLGR